MNATATERQTILTNGEARDSGDDLLAKVLAATAQGQRKQYSVAEMELMAKKAAASRMFGAGEDGRALMTEDQAFMLMMIAEATNIHPVLALLRWELVKGKPAMKSAYVLAEYQRLGGNVDWEITTAQNVKAVFTCKKHPKPFVVELSLQELFDRHIASVWDDKAGKWKVKYNYVNHPRSMLRWRAVSEGVRATDPGILMGMYTEVEADDIGDPEPEPTGPEEKARAGLVDKLEKRRERIQDKVPPVAEVVETMKEIQKAREAPPPEPKSDCRLWIEGTLQSFNEVYLAARPGEKSIVASHTINHVIKQAIAEDRTKEADLLRPDGKRDTRLVGAEVNRLWDLDDAWVMDVVSRWLSEKLPLSEDDAVDAAMDEMEAAKNA